MENRRRILLPSPGSKGAGFDPFSLSLRNEGRDLILVTHHMAFARRVADYGVFLSDGTIAEAGPAAELFSEPKCQETAEFLGKVLRY